MQIGVYGSGYLGTVVSACLADFGTPVTCCHSDSSSMVEMAQGNVPFFEKNLKEVIRRNVRCGRLVYSTDMDSFAKRAQVIFLAEDNAERLSDIALRITQLALKPPVLVIVTPVAVGTASRLQEQLVAAGKKATLVSQPMFFTNGCAVEDFNWPDRIVLGTASNEAVQPVGHCARHSIAGDNALPLFAWTNSSSEPSYRCPRGNPRSRRAPTGRKIPPCPEAWYLR